MSTPATIIVHTPTGALASTVNFDGYPSHTGRILKEHYTTQEQAEELVKLGELSCLYERANPIGEHTWKNPEEGTTIAYHRDRGETKRQPRMAQSAIQLIEHFENFHNYVFENGEWTYIKK